MAWFKVDDKLHGHRKAARAGVSAMGLWVVAGSWCADQLTDGFVPDYIALRIDARAEELAAELVEAGLWLEDTFDGDRGWRFHDWDEYQPTREDIESRREYEREKKRRQRRDEDGRFVSSRRESPRESRGDTRRDTPGDRDGSPQGSPTVPTRPDPSRPVPTGSGSDLAVSHGSEVEVSSRNPWFDAVVAALDMPARGSHEGLFGRIAAKAKAQGHPPAEILNRAALHLATFDFPLTPGSLHKRWDELGSKVVTATPTEKKRVREELERMRQREQIMTTMGEGQ